LRKARRADISAVQSCRMSKSGWKPKFPPPNRDFIISYGDGFRFFKLFLPCIGVTDTWPCWWVNTWKQLSKYFLLCFHQVRKIKIYAVLLILHSYWGEIKNQIKKNIIDIKADRKKSQCNQGSTNFQVRTLSASENKQT